MHFPVIAFSNYFRSLVRIAVIFCFLSGTVYYFYSAYSEPDNPGDHQATNVDNSDQDKNNHPKSDRAKTVANILVRIFKQEAAVEIWRQGHNQYSRLAEFDICSSNLATGPKRSADDGRRPEGFYHISSELIRWHWKEHPDIFNLAYPNSYDLARGRTKAGVSIHSDCSSKKGFALRQPDLNELLDLLKAALNASQSVLPVHIYPFRMEWSTMSGLKKNHNYPFWLNLKEVYDHFETRRLIPEISVCGQRYWVEKEADKKPDASSKLKKCIPLQVAEDIGFKTASQHDWLLRALKSQGLTSWSSPRMLKRIKVTCNLKRPTCKRWLKLRQQMLARGTLPPELIESE